MDEAVVNNRASQFALIEPRPLPSASSSCLIDESEQADPQRGGNAPSSDDSVSAIDPLNLISEQSEFTDESSRKYDDKSNS